MHRSEHGFLTTHTGSLIRPDALADEPGPDAGPDARAAYERELTAAVAGVVARQAEVGLSIVNDGEFGKSSWAAYAIGRVSGFEIRPGQLMPVDWLGRDRERFGSSSPTTRRCLSRARRARAGVRRSGRVHRSRRDRP